MKKIANTALLITLLLVLPGCRNRKKNYKELQGCSEKKCNVINSIDDYADEIIIDDDHKSNKEKIKRKSIFVDEIYEGDKSNFFENEITPVTIQEIPSPEQTSLQEGESTLVHATSEITTENLYEEEMQPKLGTSLFAFDEYREVNGKEQQKALENVYNTLAHLYKDHPSIQVLIKGHACNSAGSDRYNIQLSHLRAESIKKEIVKKIGIPEKQVTIIGCGTAELLVEGSREEQSVNRRAEIYYVIS